MANITRIRTNQISDGNVTAAKIASGTLVGSLFAPSLSLNSNVTILGNLSVSGNSSVINSVNTYIQDPIVVFNNGYTGSMSGIDVGILVNRNFAALGPYGAVNTAWVWVENDQAFESITTTTTGNALSTLTSSGFANLKVGNITTPSISASGTITAGLFSGPISTATLSATTLVATNFSSGNILVTGGSATGLTNLQSTGFGATTGVITNLSSANAQITGGSLTGDVTVQGTTGQFTNFSTGNALITAAGITTGVVTNLSSGNVVITGGYLTGLSNVYSSLATVTNFSTANAIITSGSATTLVATNFSSGNVVLTGSASASTLVATNLSTANLLVTGGSATGLTNLQSTGFGATTGVVTNLSTGNAVITNAGITTAVATNLSTANLLVTGGSATGLTNLQSTGFGATTGVVTNFSSANASVTALGATTAVITNLSSGNITGTFNGTVAGTVATANVSIYDSVTALTTNQTFYPMFSNTSANGNTIAGVNSSITVNPSTGTLGATAFTGTSASITNIGATTAVVTNFSTANAQITGGSLTGDVTVQGTTGQFTNFSTGNALITAAGITTGVVTNFSSGNVLVAGGSATGLTNLQSTGFGATTGVVTNFSTGNAQITGGATNGLTTLGATTGVVTNFSSANLVSTSAGHTTLVSTNFSSGNAQITGGFADNFPIGANTTASGAFTTLAASGITQITNSTNSAQANSTGALQVTGGASINKDLWVGGNVYAGNLVTVSTTQLTVSEPLLYLTGTPSPYNFDIGFYSHFVGGAPSHYQHTGLVRNYIDNDWYLFSNVGEPSANVVNLADSNLIYDTLKLGGLLAVNTTPSTSTTTGALVVSGGAGIAGAMNVGGTTIFSATVPTTGPSTGALQVTNGGAYIAGNLWVAGNINFTPGMVNTITGNSGVFYGNAAGSGALYAGVTGYTPLNNTVLQLTTNLNSYGQVNNQNINSGSSASTDFIATANNGTDVDTYIDMGINSSTYSVAGFGLSKANDGYLYVYGNTTTGGGNLLLATSTANDIIFATAGQDTANEQARFKNGVGLVIKQATTATNTTSGALQVAGGVGIQGALYAGSINNTPISGSTGSFTTAQANNFSTGNALITAAGVTTLVATNFSSANASVTALGATTAVATNLSTGNALITAAGITTGVVTNLSSANVLVTGGSATGLTNLQSTGFGATTAVVTNFSTANAQITGGSLTGDVTVQGTTGQFTNFSSGNVLITGGTLTGISLENITTLTATNFSSGNVLITGGYISSVANVQSPVAGFGTTTTGTLNATTGNITNIGTSNIVATVGSVGTLVATTGFSAANAIITNASHTTMVSTNFSSGNAVISGGSLNGTPIGATSASSAIFTTAQTYSTFSACGQVQASSGISSTSTGTGAIVVQGGVGLTGNINMGGNLNVGSINYTPLNAPVTVGFNINGYSQFAIQNTNSGNNASTDIAAVANNGSDNDTYVDMGIVSSTYNQAAYSLYKPNDGYLIVAGNTTTGGGNLILNTYQQNDIIFATGGTFANAEVARFHGNATTSGYLNLAYTTNASPATNTGALRVQGGASFASNVYVGGATIFNGSQTAGYDVVTKGKTDTSLIWARPNATYDSVIVGGSATASTAVNGAKLLINSTDSIMLPVGSSGQRPSQVGYTDVTGMLRYSTTQNAIEWYNGAAWASATTSFTVIVDQQFSGDGSTTVFTLSQASTSAGTIISINGVVQIPGSGYAYSVTGTTLTFTEAPAVGDLIDVRILTTTSSVNALSGTYTSIDVSNDSVGVLIKTGVGSTANVMIIAPGGAIVNTVANVTAATASAPGLIDTWSPSSYSSAEYTITSTIQGTNIREMTKILVVTDGTSANTYRTVYGVTSTSGNTMTSWSANVTSGNVTLYATPTNANMIYRVRREYQAI